MTIILMWCTYNPVLFIFRSASDHIDFNATLTTVPELPHCLTEFPPAGPFNLDDLDVRAYMCLHICVALNAVIFAVHCKLFIQMYDSYHILNDAHITVQLSKIVTVCILLKTHT